MWTSCSRNANGQPAQAALIAVDPRTGEVLALVGGRTYNQSQYNRAIAAKRQPGRRSSRSSTSSAFERAAAEGRTDLTPATVVIDEPTSWEFNQQTWTPGNYDGEFEGPVTLRRALALSRNIPTIKVAETTGYDQVAALWKRVGASTPPRPYPSIALGVFEATPFEIATAYTLFPNGGTIKPLARDLAAHQQRRQRRGAPCRSAADDRAPGHDVPRHQHDAQRDERGNRRRRTRRRVHAGRRRKVRHDQ